MVELDDDVSDDGRRGALCVRVRIARRIVLVFPRFGGEGWAAVVEDAAARLRLAGGAGNHVGALVTDKDSGAAGPTDEVLLLDLAQPLPADPAASEAGADWIITGNLAEEVDDADELQRVLSEFITQMSS